MTSVNPIREAASLLPGHWYQGNVHDENRENFCGIGMTQEVISNNYNLYAVDEVPPEYFQELRRSCTLLSQTAGAQYPDRTAGLNNFAAFNDHKDTTEEEVVAVMEKAAVKWDELYG